MGVGSWREISMFAKEKETLVKRILKAQNDPKDARIAASVFLNKATKKDATVFLSYLEGTDIKLKQISEYLLKNINTFINNIELK